MNGQGTFKRANGNAFTGKWLDNKKHGQVTWKMPNGDEFEGAYVKGKKHGIGILTKRSEGGKSYIMDY